MKTVKYFIFSLVCLFSCNIVFATNEITVDSMIPVYDENSGVIVTEENGEHSVIFNDKDQSVKYNIVLKNNTDNDISLENVVLPKPTEDFLKYELTIVGGGAVLEANSTKDVVLSLETIKKEGWGRNFNEELATNITFDKIKSTNPIQNVVNPNTGDKKVVLLLSFLTCTIGLSIIVIFSKNKVARYMILVITLSSTLTITNAQGSIVLPIKINVSFESQNVMSKSGKDGFKCGVSDACYIEDDWFYFWKHSDVIKNIYIENAKREIKDYAYEYDVSEEQNGRVKAYLVENANDSDYYDLYLIADGMIYTNSDASYYFAFFDRLETINNLEGLDTSNVTDMSHMFYLTGSYNTNFTLDLSSLDTGNVINMESMFKSTGSSSTNFTLDLSSFNTSNVTDMRNMFDHTGYNSTNFTLDLSSFDTSNVIDMSYMFYYTGYNSTNFTLDLSSFDTSNVTDMGNMFAGTGRNNPTFTLDLGDKFDTSNVTDMSAMFSGTGYRSSIFTLDVSNFDTSNVINMQSMFSGTGYSSPNFTLDVSNFDTSNVTSMSDMFYNAGYSNPNFTLDVSNFDTSNVTYMQYMFNGTGYNSTKFITSITIKNPKTTSYSTMFKDVATKNGSQITVNYTSETSELVDKMIATKSSNSNVIKGVQVD